MKIELPVRGKSIASVKGQTVIPKEIRKAAGIKDGTKLTWILQGGQLTVVVIPDDPVAASVGVLEGHGTFEGWLEERNEDRARERKLEEERRWQDMSSTPQP